MAAGLRPPDTEGIQVSDTEGIQESEFQVERVTELGSRMSGGPIRLSGVPECDCSVHTFSTPWTNGIIDNDYE
jgi:hypothetical protein